MMIVGAGLSGLIAAHAWPDAYVREAMPEPRETHKALLRFRGQSVSNLVGVPFKRVLVRKGVYDAVRECYVEPSMRLSNMYSRKVTGRLVGDRSIWDLAPVERWIAPEDLYDRMVERVGRRITWGVRSSPGELAARDWEGKARETVVSTIPLPALCEDLGLQTPGLLFERKAICVQRFRLARCDLYQTVYIPSPVTPIYRASITGDLAIVESIMEDPCALAPDEGEVYDLLEKAFCAVAVDAYEPSSQHHGKINPVDDIARRMLLAHITQQHGIYSLGRFACWRNLLLDDLPQDIAVIKSLSAHDAYSARLTAARA